MSKKLYKIVSVVVSILFTVNSISFAVPDISQSMQKEPALRAPSAGLERTPGALISSLSALPGIPGRQTGRTVAQTALGSLPKASSAGLIDIGDFAEVRPVELISELIERTANISGSARTQLMELQQELSVLKKLTLKAFNELIRKHHVKGEWSLIVPAIGEFLFEGTGLFLFAAELRHYDARSAIIYDLIAISAEKEPVYHAVDIELRSEAVFAAIIAEADASRLLDLYSIDAYKQQIDEEAEGLAIELEVAGNRKVSICARSDIYVAALAQNEPKLNEELAKVKQDVFLNKHLGPGETEAVVRNLQLTELRRDSFVYMGVWDTDRDSSIERRYLFRIRTEFGGREFIFSSGALISSPEQLRAINETLSALQVNTIGVVMPAKESSAGETSPIDTVVIDESIFPESKKVADTFRKGRVGLKKLEYVLGCKVKLLSGCEPGQDENLTRIIITDKVLMPFSKAVFCIIKDKKLLEGPYHLQPAILAVITAEEHIYKDNQQYEAALKRATQTYGEAFKKAVYDILVSHYETDFIRPDRDILLKSRDYPADCLPPDLWPKSSSAGMIEIGNMKLKVEEPGYPFEKLRQLLARQRPWAKAPVALMSQNKIRSYLSGFSALSELSDIDLTSLVALNNPANKKQRLIIFWARPKEAGGKLCPNMLIGAEVGEEGYGFVSKKVTDISTWYPDRLGIRAGTPTFGAWSKALMEWDRMMKAAGQKASSAGININTFANVRPVTKIEHLSVGGPEIKMTVEGKRQLELLRQELARLDKITLEDFNALITKRREDFSQIVPAIGAFTYGEKKLILFAADISYIDTGEEKIIHDGSEPYYDLAAISAEREPQYYAVDGELRSEYIYEAVISQAIAQAPERIRSQSGFISAYTGLLSEIARKLVITLDLEDGSGVNILPRSDIHTRLIRRNDKDLWYELNQVSSICFNNRYEDPRAIENTVKYGHLVFERLNESSFRYVGELRERPEDKTEDRLRHLFSIEEKAANGRGSGRIFIFSSGAPIPSPSQLAAIGETAPEPYRNRIALAKTLKASSAGDESDQQLPGQELMDKETVLEDLLINRLATPEKAATLTEEVLRQYRQGVADILMKVTQAGAEGKISRDLQQEIEAKLRIQHRLIHLADLFGHIIKQAVTGDIILDTESIIKDSAQRELIENIFSNEVIKGALEGALSKKTQETSEPTARVLLLKDLAKYRDNITSEKPVIIISNDAEKLDLFNNAKLLNPGENISALAVPYQIGLAATLLTLDQQANKAPLIAKLESLSWQLRRIPLDTTLIEKLKSGEWDIFNFIITTLPTVEAADIKETDRRVRAAVAALIAV